MSQYWEPVRRTKVLRQADGSQPMCLAFIVTGYFLVRFFYQWKKNEQS